MPLVPGLSPNIRQMPAEGTETAVQPSPILIIEGNGDTPHFDAKGNVIKIEHDDGTVTISLDGSSLSDAPGKNTEWFGNLVEDIESDELARISDDLLRAIKEDLESRQEWIEERAQGIRLLGLKMEVPGVQGAADGAPVEGMSRVRHPILQEAVLRFQANARAELLPTDGPVKIRVETTTEGPQEDQLANALEMDMNHYLTSVATEYYPDTDRMLLMLGFGGTSFKKVYYCPIRQRPVSETVDADDLIVNNSATDLANAKRVTHRSYSRPSIIRRMQILGVYRDIDLSEPKEPDLDAVQRQQNEQQGIRVNSMRPDDRDREIYECYCELDIKGFEHKDKGKESGLEIPYRVTIDTSSREILSIVRNYEEESKALPEAKNTFVKYTFVPGFGFYDIGLLNILGNTANALTAALRELLDAGMFASFPGFLIQKAATRQQTNIFRIPPGGGVQVDTNGIPIRDAIMAPPYSGPSPALMTLVESMTQMAQRVGGTAELQVGEGRADAPVGTTLTMVEQATKLMNAVHKRMHAAQAQEFRLLAELMKEHPECIVERKNRNKKQTYQWTVDTFRQALDDYDLEPQADPNTSSYGQRVLKYFALKQLSAASPGMYDPIAIDSDIITNVLQLGNPQQFFAPPSAMAAPPPELQQAQAKMASEGLKAQAAMVTAQARMKEATKPEAAEAPGDFGRQVDTPVDIVTAKAKMLDAETKAKNLQLDRAGLMLDDANTQDELKSRHSLEILKLAKDVMDKRADMALDHQKHQQEMGFRQQEHAAQMQQHREGLAADHSQHSAELAAQSHIHETGMKPKEQLAAIAAKSKAKAAPKGKPK